MALYDGVPDMDEVYDRETNRRKRNPIPRPTGNPGLIKTGPTGILAQLKRSAGRPVGTPVRDETVGDFETERFYDDMIAEREREQDQAAARAKMDRDFPEPVGRCVCHVVERGAVRPCSLHPVTRTGPLAQDNQKSLFRYLLGQLRTHNPAVWEQASTWFQGVEATITKTEISRAITRLRERLAAPAVTPSIETMARHGFADDAPVRRPGAEAWRQWRDLAGKLVGFGGHTGARFAVDTEPGVANEIAFWWIVPDDRTGRYYLRQVIGGQGAVRVRMSPEAMVAIAQKIIAADPKEAMLRYGREIGACGHCGRTLTNDESRAYGIGPVCRRGKGW